MKRKLYSERDAEGYFDGLPKGTQDLVFDILNETFDAYVTDTYPYDAKDRTEEIECRSRDGFIPHWFNRGGLEVRVFKTLGDLLSSGAQVSHKKAQAEIERQTEYMLKLHREHVFEKFQDLLKTKGIAPDKINYSDLNYLAEQDADLKQVANYFEDTEHDFLDDSESTIMFTVRFMYHGKIDGEHSASISAAVNTEGPYHRSHISWAPEIFCEGAKEIEITWRNQTELKKALKRALETVCKAVL